MALSTEIISLIRDEVGDATDFSDNDPAASTQLDSLENIYTSANRGNYSILRTALIVWRRRLASNMNSSFDATTEGSLMSRSQKTRYLREMVAKYEMLVDSTLKVGVQSILPQHHEEASDDGAEFAT